MWIFCCGAKRSGSTLQYNIAARIVELNGSGIRIDHRKPSEFPEVRDAYKDDSRIKVFKSHHLTEPIKDEILRGNAKALFCFRDVRDVVVSYIKQKWVDRSEESLVSVSQAYLANYDTWMSIADHLLVRKYEEFYDNIPNEVRIIAQFLGIQLDENTVRQIARELDSNSLKAFLKSEDFSAVTLETFKFDKKTLLHENHIQGLHANQFLQEFSPKAIALVEKIASGWLVKNGYKLFWPTTNEFVSFSQHADDYIAWQLLNKPSSGLVVEVGAFDGVHLSNSYSLELRGWRSLCIEPNPDIFQHLKGNRRKSVNVNCAVVGDASIQEVEFFVEKIGVLSGIEFDEHDVKERYDRRGLTYESPSRVRVAAKTLDQIFDENGMGPNDVDLLSIDVEGYELEVLKGFDIERFRPKLLVVEANTPKQKDSIMTFFSFLKKKYVYVGSNYQNLFFQSKESFNKDVLNGLDLRNFFAARQNHPFGGQFAIQSRRPHFTPNAALRRRKGLFSFLFRK